jgi:allophanate hydrolase subunit 2
MYTTIPVHAGDELILHRAIQGSRSYLAVSKGIQTPKILNSRSMYQGVTESFRISKGDELAIDESPIKLKSNAVVKGRIESPENIFLKAFKGPEFNQLKTHQIETLGSMYFTISKESNRMAFPLEENFSNQLDPIITSLVLPGTVQLTPGGKLIILMRDCQITGGYPRILQLTKVAINTLAQKQLKDKIRFTII